MGGWYKMDANITARTDLTANAKLVYAILQDHARRTGEAWPGRRRLARLAGCSPETIRTALVQLVEAQIIVPIGNTRGSSARFRMVESGTDSVPVGGTDFVPLANREVVQFLGGGGTETVPEVVQFLGTEAERAKEAENTPLPPKGNDVAERIYLAYPRRIGKQAALKAITKALRAVGQDKMLAATEAYASAVSRWAESDRKYVPHPATWFNRGSYDDDPREWERKAPLLIGRIHDSTDDEFGRIDGYSNGQARAN